MAENMTNSAGNSAAEQAKCPNCGGVLVYDALKGTLSCPYCGSKVDLGYWQDHELSGFNFKDIESHAMQAQAENIPIYNCVSCGAEILAAKEEVSLTCPYCSNNIVLTDKVSGKLRPNVIVPFKITKEQLPKALNEFYKDKRLLPKNFFSESRLGKVTGVYVPFWVFDGGMSGDVSYSGEKVSTYQHGDQETTNISEYKLLRSAAISFKDLPIDASEKLDDALMDSIMPFDLSEAKEFNIGYLAGYAADRFDVPSDNLAGRAEARMRKTAYATIQRKAGEGYSNVRFWGGQLAANIKNVKYMLLPVYTFTIQHGGKDYSFAMNGQTGKVVGNVPTGKSVSMAYQQVRALVVAAAFLGISFILYLMGM